MTHDINRGRKKQHHTEIPAGRGEEREGRNWPEIESDPHTAPLRGKRSQCDWEAWRVLLRTVL